MTIGAVNANLIACETVAAITIHLRPLGDAGPKYGGGADTLALCGAKVSWDLQCDTEQARCQTCRKAAGMSLYPEGLRYA